MNRTRCIASLIVGMTIIAQSASGQSSPAAGGDGAQCVAVRPDTTTGFIYGSLAPDSPNTKIDRERFLGILGRLSASLADDTLTLLPVTKVVEIEVTRYSRRPSARPRMLPRWPGHPALTTEIAFTVEESGDLTDARTLGRGDSATGALLLQAVARVRSVGPTGTRGSARLRLRLSLTPDSSAVSIPMLAARQLTLHGTPPSSLTHTVPLPGPIRGRRPLQATVMLWYVIDANGSPVKETLGTAPAADPDQATDYREFVEAAKEAVLGARYTPGQVGGCPAAWRAIFLLRFNVEPPPGSGSAAVPHPDDREHQ